MRMKGMQVRFESWIKEQTEKIVNASWSPLQLRLQWLPWATERNDRKRIKQEFEQQKKKLEQLCLAVKADSIADLQDILCCMVLAECVYKKPATEVLRSVNQFKADFGSHLVSLERVQSSSDHVPHRYLLAEAGDTLFASFIGTKQYKDIVTDANILQGAIFHDDADEQLQWDPLPPGGAKGRQPKPAAHRGFMARAKGIPALELYKLAQKKKRKLVLCGHSLGGAVAALATLSILRTIAKESKIFDVKCITFSQPPVGNAALRDYVNKKGWQHHFRSYCIPEDLVPRILSPAYFHHYKSQTLSDESNGIQRPVVNNNRDRLALGLGSVQTSFWRLSRLLPINGLRNQTKSIVQGVSTRFGLVNTAVRPEPVEIQEGSSAISLVERKNSSWNSVPSLPSYVPFGKLLLLGNSSVDLLSGAEYSKLTSVKSVIAELKERLGSHSMRSYRSRFQRIYETCTGESNMGFLGVEQVPKFSHLQRLLGVPIDGAVDFAEIVESPMIKTATSLVPLGWTGVPGDKNCDMIKVDVMGFRLHLCSLVEAQINGQWCATVVQSCSSIQGNQETVPQLQRMRVLVGAPLKKLPSHLVLTEPLLTGFPSFNPVNSNGDVSPPCPDGLLDFSIHCTSDFSTVSKDVSLRTRRVRLVGLEGAGKTSLVKAITSHCKTTPLTNFENFHEVVADGVWYSDSDGVNIQDLKSEVDRFKDELRMGAGEIGWKTDLVIFVHNLSHKIPRWAGSAQPAASLLIHEARTRGIPWLLAITNKFSVSVHQQNEAIDDVISSYEASRSTTQVLNSCSYVTPSLSVSILPPFTRKEVVLPIEGVTALCGMVRRVLATCEEDSLKELANDRLVAELARERISEFDANRSAASPVSAAAVGASLGAGLGVVLAIVMGAASALRKP